jgi:hypothetical protein
VQKSLCEFLWSDLLLPRLKRTGLASTTWACKVFVNPSSGSRVMAVLVKSSELDKEYFLLPIVKSVPSRGPARLARVFSWGRGRLVPCSTPACTRLEGCSMGTLLQTFFSTRASSQRCFARLCQATCQHPRVKPQLAWAPGLGLVVGRNQTLVKTRSPGSIYEGRVCTESRVLLIQPLTVQTRGGLPEGRGARESIEVAPSLRQPTRGEIGLVVE